MSFYMEHTHPIVLSVYIKHYKLAGGLGMSLGGDLGMSLGWFGTESGWWFGNESGWWSGNEAGWWSGNVARWWSGNDNFLETLQFLSDLSGSAMSVASVVETSWCQQ